jgi:ribonucleoside-diphosphate reductase alpha chain
MAMAPTGTISLVPECTGGIEPLAYKAYKRKDEVSTRYYIHPKYKEALLNDGACPDWLVDSRDLDPIHHVELQGVIQRYVDGAVSKTINVPRDFRDDSLSDLLLESISDLKGVTVYRDGSREGQPLVPLTEKEAVGIIKKDLDAQNQDEEALVCSKEGCAI